METSEHSESTNDEPAHARDLELVRSAQRGDSAPRAVLAGRLACVPLEVARRAGTDPGDFRVEARAQLTWILEQLPQFDGSTPLEDWALERVRERLPAGRAAPDPEALAETVDVERLLDRTLVRTHHAPSTAARLRRGLPLAGVAVLLSLFLWDDPEFGTSPDAVHGGDVRLLSPVGESSGWGDFQWLADVEEGYSARVVVTMPTGAVLRSPALEQSSWSPTPEQLSALTDNFRWQVIESDSLGSRRGWARAWLPAR